MGGGGSDGNGKPGVRIGQFKAARKKRLASKAWKIATVVYDEDVGELGRTVVDVSADTTIRSTATICVNPTRLEMSIFAEDGMDRLTQSSRIK
jgi:hypothetical protein